jgi:titin
VNSFVGIGVLLQTKGGDVIQGNYIGTDASGTLAQGNGIGVDIASGTNQIGGTTSGLGNVISGNTGNGIILSGSYTAGNVVQGNFIGTDPTGTKALANGASGVMIVGPGNTIGGTLAGAGNVISGNQAGGVTMFGNGTTSNLVQGNFIGTDSSGTKALGNGGSGVSISSGATNNTIGGTSAAARNVISANAREGVTIWIANQNLVQGNYIGTDRTGTKALGNSSVGVVLFGAATNNTIGGTAAGAGNVISANSGGLAIVGNGTMNNLVQGNFIGTDSSGTAALGNKNNGVAIAAGATQNTIGGTSAGARNLIAGNIGNGLLIFGSATQNFVQGNFIGTDVTGAKSLGNTGNGVFINASNNLIGGTTPGAGNTIAYNGNDGVLVDTGTGNGIRGNSIFGHTGLGIQLVNNGNNMQAYPELKVVHSNDGDDDEEGGHGKFTIKGTLNSTPNSQFTIEWFANNTCNASGFGEGKTFIGSMIVTTNAQGRAKFTMTFAAGVPGQFITATATDANNNTSQFSRCVRIGHGESDDSEQGDDEEGNMATSMPKGEAMDIIRALVATRSDFQVE